MIYIEGDVYPEPPPAGDEISTLLGSLERQRATFAWKCDGLDQPLLSQGLHPTAITLSGLLKHMALVESHSFEHKFLGRDLGAPWDAIDWDADPDWEWRTARDDPREELVALWQRAVEESRAIVREALAEGGLDSPGRTWPDGRTPSLRRILVDTIEEYARHVGHADLIRESIDGLVGEDPPR
jgi:hypothetical protein